MVAKGQAGQGCRDRFVEMPKSGDRERQLRKLPRNLELVEDILLHVKISGESALRPQSFPRGKA